MYSTYTSKLATVGFTFIFCFTGLAIICSLVVYFINLSRIQHFISLRRVRRHRGIARFDILGENNLLERLYSRAKPNQRLVKVFGIHNSFTTTDPEVHQMFVVSVRNIIRNMTPQRWTSLFKVAEAAVAQACNNHLASRDSLPLAITVRFVVFSAMVYEFFGVILGDADFDDAVQATRAINKLWVLSRDMKSVGPELREEHERLQDSLRRLLPNRFPCTPEKHPLNIIMPAYETMWRVVLLTYVSAGFREVHPETAQQFQEVIQSVPEYSTSGSTSKVTRVAINFAKEGLRLYPPTKRVHRAVKSSRSGEYNIEKADVEWCHRNTHIWGADADQFRPSRFQKYTADMQEAYMPFGAGPHQCPTASSFSYNAIIILVVALAKRLGTRETGTKVSFNNISLNTNPRALLPSGRMDMENWTLEMNGAEWLGRAM